MLPSGTPFPSLPAGRRCEPSTARPRACRSRRWRRDQRWFGSAKARAAEATGLAFVFRPVLRRNPWKVRGSSSRPVWANHCERHHHKNAGERNGERTRDTCFRWWQLQALGMNTLGGVCMLYTSFGGPWFTCDVDPSIRALS